MRRKSPAAPRKRTLWFLFLAAVVFRLTLLPLTPTLSHQLWRVHWDGEIAHAGFNPFVYAPNNGLFSPIRTPADAAIPDSSRAAVHPPLAEILFHWDYDWFPGLRSEKIFFVIADLLLIALLMRMLRQRQLPVEWVVLYAWSPLAVFEVAGNGHMAPVAALLAILALGWSQHRARASGVAAAAAALSLWYAFTLVPLAIVGAGKRWARSLRWGIAFAVLVSLPFWVASQQFVLGDIVRNLRIAAAAAPFNASLYALLHAAAGAAGAAILAAGFVVLSIVLVCVRKMEPLRAALWLLTVLLLLLPQVHPWFVLWLLPLVVFVPNPAWLYFSVAVIWAYAVGHQPGWVVAEYVPLYALLGWQLWHGRRRSGEVRVEGAHP
ncbi:MAG: hypothetical protein ACRD1F_00045 [Terriglobales bacterium]